MRSLLGDAACLQHIDAVAVHHIGQTVGDQDHCFLSRQAVDGFHDIVLALGIHIGGRLVEHIDG